MRHAWLKQKCFVTSKSANRAGVFAFEHIFKILQHNTIPFSYHVKVATISHYLSKNETTYRRHVVNLCRQTPKEQPVAFKKCRLSLLWNVRLRYCDTTMIRSLLFHGIRNIHGPEREIQHWSGNANSRHRPSIDQLFVGFQCDLLHISVKLLSLYIYIYIYAWTQL